MPGDDKKVYVKLPDGSYAQFPSSMKEEEITAAIQKNYPPEQPSREDAAAERHARSRVGKVANSGEGPDTGAAAMMDRLGKGVVNTGKELLFPEGHTEGERLQDISNKLVTGPMAAERQKAMNTTGVESLGHEAAGVLPIIGPAAAQAGEVLGRGDPYGVVDAAMAIGGAKAAGGMVSDIADAGLRSPAAIRLARGPGGAGRVQLPLPNMMRIPAIERELEAAIPKSKQAMAVEDMKQRGTFMNSGYKSAMPVPPEPAPIGQAGVPENSGVMHIREPRPLAPGEKPGTMYSIPREQLEPLARTGKPGALDTLRDLGRKAIVIPEGTGFPGPRESFGFPEDEE